VVGFIRRSNLPKVVGGGSGSAAPGPNPVLSPTLPPLSPEEEATRDALLAALRETGGNVSETARRLGKARQQIQRWLRRFAIDPAAFQGKGGTGS
jgi:transcriptional regulator of acetoin/glycerol metabolism